MHVYARENIRNQAYENDGISGFVDGIEIKIVGLTSISKWTTQFTRVSAVDSISLLDGKIY